MSVACGILVGGLSRRMGQPKALISIDGTTLLERTALIAGTVISDIVLIGRPTFEMPWGLSAVPVIDDDPAGRGPIGGLAGFFKSKPECDCLLLACDMPGLEAELLRRLIAATDDEVDAVVPRENSDGGAIHPCCALFRLTTAPTAFDAIAACRFAMHDLLDNLRVRWLPLERTEATWVENVNTPADLHTHGGRSGHRPDDCRLDGTTKGGPMTRTTVCPPGASR